jgi:hypothetical protein
MSSLRLGSLAAFAVLVSAPAWAAGDNATGQVAAVPSPLSQQPLEQLSATRERPLFSPTRHPPPAPVSVVEGPPPPPPPPPPPDVALFGVVMDGEQARAVIRASPTDKTTRVGIGDDVGGWKVAQIEGRKLVLSLDGRLVTFIMFSGKAGNDARRADSAPQTVDEKPQQPAAPAIARKESGPGRHRVRSPN